MGRSPILILQGFQYHMKYFVLISYDSEVFDYLKNIISYRLNIVVQFTRQNTIGIMSYSLCNEVRISCNQFQ